MEEDFVRFGANDECLVFGSCAYIICRSNQGISLDIVGEAEKNNHVSCRQKHIHE
ncbi:unnamed protein product [Sphenostylis stenocarpa]|uniref:Uncharacterized protein n=1 Tax=Sphenostylis stenocarpa TaxID=92480 RepID=A0AA86TGL3_9FABA|nr:unnamed protein product [Sphenostylis stenocarpa]